MLRSQVPRSLYNNRIRNVRRTRLPESISLSRSALSRWDVEYLLCGLNQDPTEERQQKCASFFGNIMQACFQAGFCCCLTSCCVGLCAPDSEGAQECSGEAGRASRACCSIAHTLWKGIMFTRVIAMGCMSAQMVYEMDTPWDGKPKGREPVMEPLVQEIDRK
jgi:hypothetical protein